MKRRRPAPRPHTRPKAKPGRTWVVVAVGVAMVVVIGFLVRPGRLATPDRPLDLAAAERAYRRALDLAAAGRCLESLPDFRAAAEARPESWGLHHDHASALLNAAHEGRVHLGHAEFAVRSSYERVALLREGLGEIEIAERLARQPRDRAQVHLTRAQILKAWGLPWNAFQDYRASEWADTTWHQAAHVANAYMDLMADPTRPGD